jgi:KipI family sensor histidine kinase inhibitor
MTISPLGDQALLITVAEGVGEATLARVQQLIAAIATAAIPGVRETVGASAAVGVMLDDTASRANVEARLRTVIDELPDDPPAVEGREQEVPACYGGEFGPDLPRLAQHAGLSLDATIKAHSTADYRVLAVGFSPGFPYLGGLVPRLHMPRRATPRPRVPAGTVGIGGAQTGIYPLETPGGWQLIARTPHPLFEPSAPSPAWLRPGDRIRFRPITREQFNHLDTVVQDARRAALPTVAAADAITATVDVVRPGVQTTVQDLGRYGWQSIGVPVSGAADVVALQIANTLVGNPPGAAALEWARRGPVLRFQEDRVVAVTGVEPENFLAWRPRLVRAGETIDLTHARSGMRGYLAISGGIDVPEVLGSRSTCLVGRFGGYRGRPLRTGDAFVVGEPAVTQVRPGWYAAVDWREKQPDVTMVRVVRGPQVERFTSISWRVLTESTFHTLPASDRMGLRLDGATLALDNVEELISAPVAAGAVQVPPDGRPIILLADRQTLGGYSQIAYVISADLPQLAQVRPGGRVRFAEVSLEEAERARRTRLRDLGFLRVGVRAKLQ